ncbi:hypothetical protein CBS147346_5603 [Aspergillus niger]|nr:hypothetical protein CBS147346_5603 [Aspergillus niger]
MSSADLTSSLEDFLTQTYDYLIIGGGTAGLVGASRLSANPDVRVGVIEAGDTGFDDPNFTNPGKILAMLHNPKYDWMYQSTLSVLGGSSAIKFMAYGRPSAVDLDDWGTVAGYSDWSWAGLAPHYRKSEQLESAGLTGPASDLCPVQEEAHVTRILLDDKQCACGAEFVFDSNHYQVTVTREVILSAGTFESPQLLELSGIGEPEHLASLGVSCRVPLPGVGTNLQDHPVSAVVYELADGVLSIDAILRDESLLKQHLQLLQEQHSGAFSGPVSLMGFIPYWPQVSAERLNEIIVSVLQPHSDNATDDADLVTFQHR